ncbi:ICE2-domain-containing protein [Diplogelasinospora grovesii]|uniref:ICE2-domain-containing protein n=1 Tax=Diplogelasinospora grovesii TaxID=303347 RepID=A0AAN6NHR2_9PEZI|nr:ICE2-domain-containing protein [Diplogelasinospora grovesii]
MWWFISAVSSAIFLLSIVLSIPIAFDVGGRDAGLAFSLSLFLFYFFYSTAKLLTPETSRVRWLLTNLVRLSQWIVIPTLLIWSLNRFSVDADAGTTAGWVSRTFAHVTAHHKPNTSWHEWFFGQNGVLEMVSLGGWDNALSYSSPVFQLLEGFCSLLVIQAAGQITRWLVNRGRSDTWVIILLVVSGSIISSAFYFLWRVAHFPQINNLDATLIGVTMTSAVFLCAYGIGSGRGNPVESSLLFAYVVLCVYQIFTDYQPSAEAAAAADLAAANAAANQPEFPPLPPIIMASYSTLIHMLSSLPSAVNSSFQFLYAAFQTITPSVIISLTYRIIVFYCATRIIPAVRESGARALMEEPNFEESSDAASRLLGFLSWFSPSMLIAVYTSLLLQHFSVSNDDDGVGWTLRAGDAGGNPWRWINVAATMGLYAIELYLGGDGDDGLHWKVE